MTSEFVLIGGGIYGTGTAWELARRGYSVTLLEADEIASGASGGLGKRGVRMNGRDHREFPIASRASELWPLLEERIDSPTGFEQTGHLLIYEDVEANLKGGFPSARPRRDLQNKYNIETELKNKKELNELEPNISDSVVGGLYCPNDGVADHTLTTRGLAKAARREGANIQENTEVKGFKQREGKIREVVTASGEEYSVEKSVLLLSNFNGVQLLRTEFGLELPVWKAYPQVISTSPFEDPPINHLIGHESRKLALKMLSEGRVMVSGGWSGKEEKGSEKGLTVPEHINGNMDVAANTFPVLEEATVEKADASRPESVSIDEIPIIDTHPDIGNLVIGLGWSGHGFAISLGVNEALAEWMDSGQKPQSLSHFSLSRF